ncbi:hypothetical protein N2152v2_002111 [Parachlorella kessleri]
MQFSAYWTLCLSLLLLGAPASDAGSPEQDRAILVQLRDSVRNWKKVSGRGYFVDWDDANPAWSWQGVKMNFHLRVTELSLTCYDYLACNKAEGLLLPALANLTRLRVLHLASNKFHGGIPPEWLSPGAFPRLEELNLELNRLTGTLGEEWARPGVLPRLRNLYLSNNSFTGSLPDSWAGAERFQGLEVLELANNPLANQTLLPSWGSRPGAFPRLQRLSLSNSRLRGPLPAPWGSAGALPSLLHLDLSSNSLSGGLPDGWGSPGRWRALRTLNLAGNQLEGALPQAWACEGCFPELGLIALPDNRLNGSLPESWARLPSLLALEVSNNRLSGSLPAAWASPTTMRLFRRLLAAGNALTGTLPASWGVPGCLPYLAVLGLAGNRLEGGLPEAWGQALALPHLIQLDLSDNRLSGPLPTQWALNSTLQQLAFLVLSNNSLTGGLPTYWGTVPDALPSLTALDLSHNQLNGTLPAEWGSERSALRSLSSLELQGNNFTGEVPLNWAMITSLRQLGVSPGNEGLCRPPPYTGFFQLCAATLNDPCTHYVQLPLWCPGEWLSWYGLPTFWAALVLGGAATACLSVVLLVVVLLQRAHTPPEWQALANSVELAGLGGKGGGSSGSGSKGFKTSNSGTGSDGTSHVSRKSGQRVLKQRFGREVTADCRIDPSDIVFCRGADGGLVVLGSGAYGQVYKAFLYGVHPVAVKVFQPEASKILQAHAEVTAEEFWKEINILRTCRHRNIVQFQGACSQGDATMMVTELMEGGDLYRALQAGKVSWYTHGLDIAVDVAQALHFLHKRNIVHFDIKSPNILLTKEYAAKIADVGWAQILYHSYITGDGGTFNWAAPEQLIGLKCTNKVDVYSLGLVLWEICTREVPVRGQIREIRVPEEGPQEVQELVVRCLNVDPHSRPGLEDIITTLQALRRQRAGGEGLGDPSLGDIEEPWGWAASQERQQLLATQNGGSAGGPEGSGGLWQTLWKWGLKWRRGDSSGAGSGSEDGGSSGKGTATTLTTTGR